MLKYNNKCNGEITRSRNEHIEQRSITDYVLVSHRVYNNYRSMNIDEERDIFDPSDHSLIQVELKFKGEKNEWKVK